MTVESSRNVSLKSKQVKRLIDSFCKIYKQYYLPLHKYYKEAFISPRYHIPSFTALEQASRRQIGLQILHPHQIGTDLDLVFPSSCIDCRLLHRTEDLAEIWV